MKKLIGCLALTLITLSTQAQSVEWFSDIVDAIYAGYDNALPLKFEDVDTDELELSVSAGSLKMSDKGRYIWLAKMTDVGQKATLTIKANNKILEEYTLKIVRIPDPVVSAIQTGRGLKGFRGLKVEFGGMRVPIKAHIQSYDVQVTKNGETSIIPNKGGNLQEHNKTLLRHAGEDAKVTMVNVIGRCPGDKAGRRLNDVIVQ
ncbi:MAG: hypothetical protein GY810_24130 [Aureispira sp.]|nr:hypothetical protein [Aureispira sp.]